MGENICKWNNWQGGLISKIYKQLVQLYAKKKKKKQTKTKTNTQSKTGQKI